MLPLDEPLPSEYATKDSEGQILALAFNSKSVKPLKVALRPFKVFPNGGVLLFTGVPRS